MKFSIGDGIDKSDEATIGKRKRLYYGIAAVVALIAVGTGSYVIASSRAKDKSSSLPYGAQVEIRRDACKLFTLDDAKKLLGEKTTASSTNANAITDTVTTSLCSYSSNHSETSKLKVLTILVRSTNAIQAKQAFEISRAANAQNVGKLGSAAYYNPDVSQLNILKDDLLIRIAGTVGTEGKGTLETPKQAGEIVVSRL